MMEEYLTLFIGAVIINNFVLTKFLGLCIFFGISKNLSASVGMGMAVTSVMTLSSILAWVVYRFVLEPFGLTFLTTIVFIVLTASFVQLLELVIKKQAPALYNMWGIYLLLIATNCIVLAVPLLNVENNYNLFKSIVFSIGSGLGFCTARFICKNNGHSDIKYSKVIIAKKIASCLGGFDDKIAHSTAINRNLAF